MGCCHLIALKRRRRSREGWRERAGVAKRHREERGKKGERGRERERERMRGRERESRKREKVNVPIKCCPLHTTLGLDGLGIKSGTRSQEHVPHRCQWPKHLIHHLVLSRYTLAGSWNREWGCSPLPSSPIEEVSDAAYRLHHC